MSALGLSQADRDSTRLLHRPESGRGAQPRSLRDASGSDPLQHWKGSPTAVPTPRNEPRRSVPSAPFKGGMPNTFDSKDKMPQRRGNTNRRMNPVALDKRLGEEGRPQKRTKTQHTSVYSNLRRPLNLNTHLDDYQDTRRHPISSTSRQEVIDLESDEDDSTGIRALTSRSNEQYSDDELNFLSSSNLRSSGRTSLDALPGPSTKIVTASLNDSQSAEVNAARDVTEIIDDDPPASAVPVRTSTPTHTAMPNVKNIIAHFEPQDQHSTVKSRMAGNPKKLAPSGLKYRPDNTGHSTSHDPTTAPSGFIAPSASNPGSRIQHPPLLAARSNSQKLPLVGWIVGTRMHQSKDTYFLEFRQNYEIVLSERDKSGSLNPFLEFTAIKSSISSVESVKKVSGKKLGCPVVKIGVIDGHVLSGPLAHQIKLSSSGGSHICIRFDADHPEWNEGTYEELTERLHSTSPNSSYISDHNPSGEPVWRALEMTGPVDGPPTLPQDNRRDRPKKQEDYKQTFSSLVQRNKSAQWSGAATKDPRVPRVSNQRRSVRLSEQSHDDMPNHSAPVLDADEALLIYPPSGRGSVNITKGDIARLAPGEYLNDTLIEFGLKHWLDKLRQSQPARADEIHVFSSFFYKKLNVRNLEEGYKAVRKWTAKVDLFSKKYLIIPVNEHYHWYLAIIYQPGNALIPPAPPNPRRSTRNNGAETIEPDDDAPDVLSPLSTVTSDESREPTALPVAGTTHPSAVTGLRRSASVDIVSDSEKCHQSSQEDDRDQLSVEQIIEPSGGRVGPPSESMDIDTLSDLGVLIYPDSFPSSPRDPSVEAGEHVGSSREDSTTAETSSGTSLHQISQEHDVDMSEVIFHLPTSTNDAKNAPRANISRAVPVTSFYGTQKANTVPYVEVDELEDVSKSASPAPVAQSAAGADSAEDAADEPNISSGKYKPLILTFDSLGGKHPGLCKKLAEYLVLEAKDKLNRDRDTLTLAVSTKAIVPTQPNSCDCGLYLLHFAKKFVHTPGKYLQVLGERPTTTADRKARHDFLQAYWDEESVRDARKELRILISSLSEEWKAERTRKEEEERKAREMEVAERKAATGSVDSAIQVSSSDSESEVEVIQEIGPPSSKRKAPIRASGNQYKSKAKTALRVR